MKSAASHGSSDGRLVTVSLLLCSSLRLCASEDLLKSIEIPDPGFLKDTRALVYVNLKMTHRQAEHVCVEEFDGHLVRMDSLEEENSVFRFMNYSGFNHHFWIGLQWDLSEGTSSDNRNLLWNDDHCTPIDSRDNYRHEDSKKYSRKKECYAAHLFEDSTRLGWEYYTCTKKQEPLCDRQAHAWKRVNIALHGIVQAQSSVTSCQELCYSLEDCFMTSPIHDGCVVALASGTGNTYVIGRRDMVVTNVNVDYEKIDEKSPGPCEKVVRTRPVSTPLSDYTLLNGTRESNTGNGGCPDKVTTVRVTDTITETHTEQLTVGNTVCGTPSITVTSVLTEVKTTSIICSTPSVYAPLPIRRHATAATTIILSKCITDVSSVASTEDRASSSQLSSSVSSETPSLSDVNTTQLMTSVYVSELTTLSMTSSQITPSLATDTVSSSRRRQPPNPSPVNIKEELLLDKSSLSKTIRAKTSATNKKASSKVIGYIMAIPFLCLLVLMIAADVWTRLADDIRYRMCVNIAQRRPKSAVE